MPVAHNRPPAASPNAAAKQHPHPYPHHQRTKSSVLRSLVLNRRNNENGTAPILADSSSLIAGSPRPGGGPGPLEEMSHNRQQDSPMQHQATSPSKQGLAAAENYPNSSHRWKPSFQTHGIAAPAVVQSGLASPSKKNKLVRNVATPTPATPTESSSKLASDRTGTCPAAAATSSSSPKKSRARPTSNLAGLLSRPKSLRNLHKLAAASLASMEDAMDQNRADRGKENNTIVDSSATAVTATANAAPTPIYAQFCTNGQGRASHDRGPQPANTVLDGHRQQHSAAKPRPKSFHPGSTTGNSMSSSGGGGSSSSSNSSTSTSNRNSTLATPLTPIAQQRGAVNPNDANDLMIEPGNINAHLEALLDRRNIPENQRYKMRNLANAIKMEFIRQDWAEERAKRQQSQSQPHHEKTSGHGSLVSTNTSADAAAITLPSTAATPTASADQPAKTAKSKHSRVKSMTFSRVTRGRSRDRGESANRNGQAQANTPRHKSPGDGLSLRKKASGTFGRHLRSKSTDSFVSSTGGDTSRPSSGSAAGATGAGITGLFTKSKGPQQHTPADFVTYLRTVQKPELVEVGKLHKLRLLLRNETVAWTEDFIRQGGMEETVNLLYRIMAIEWREEHEDALLHENLLCLKALCTTALALEYLHSIHASLLPALIRMIFDPEKKGPSEFTTRNIVTSVLLTYIQSASAQERPARAKTVLGYLRDPEADEEEKPVSFVLEMRRDRPYRVWCKEVVSVTKEVFWIFLHHLNVVALPKERRTATETAACSEARDTTELHSATRPSSPPPPPVHTDSYMARHFPHERPPVAAAPYVGGVEWEATNYLASHLDLVNAILACTPAAEERRALRTQMQMSGWERCMGSSLRLCKEKFYGAVHDGLRTWVAAAQEDGWDVRDVRFGPPPSTAQSSSRHNSPNKKVAAAGAGGLKASEPAPKLEIPKLDFVFDGDRL